MSQENYIGYQNMLTTVTTGIAELSGICGELSMPEQADELQQVQERLKNHIFSVGIMGEFRRGKSTVINALLGQEIVPSDIVPCSATLNYVRWGTEKKAQIHFKDGRVQDVAVEDLSKYVTKITSESEEMAASVDHAVVHYPCMFCQNGVQIVDTPGLNDEDRMDAIAENVIPTLDAIIMVVTADSPFSKSEAEFVRNKVMSSDLGRILFVVNKIDTVDEEDRDRLLEHIRGRIQSSVLEKMALVYGKDSDEFKNAREKVGEIRLLPISARNALRGKLKNDRRKYQESGYPEFETVLSALLTEDRGMLELIHPLNKIRSVAKEAVRTVDMRINALRMEAADFQKVQKESLATIKDNRQKKREEIKLLKTKGKTLYADLLPEAGAAYGQIREDIRQYVQQLPISEGDICSDEALKAFSDGITPRINQKITDVLAIQTERMMNTISDQLGEDVAAMESFGQALAADMNAVQTNLAVSSASAVADGIGSSVMPALVDGAVLFASANIFNSFIPGVGGLIAGWRAHGVKGAVVGGLSGVGISYAAVALLGGVGIVGLPLVLIASVASTFGGKAIANLFFGRKAPAQPKRVTCEDVRTSLLTSVDTAIENLSNERVLENWLKGACDETYAKVAENIDQEWESTLSTMEHTLSRIEADLAKSEEDRARTEQQMQDQCGKIQRVLDSLQPVCAKLENNATEAEAQPV